VARVPINDLVPYPGNARVHNQAAIAESLAANGQYRPLVIQRSTSYVLVGNGTLEGAKSLGWDHIDVTYLDIDDDRARRIVLADNRTSDLAAYDEAALIELLAPYQADLSGTAWSMDDLESLLARAGDGVMPAEPFTGGYGESQADTERRRNTGVGLASQGFKEVILVLTVEQLEAFTDRVAALGASWGTESTTATVLEALNRAT
jgi:ParB-like nuclease family protein